MSIMKRQETTLVQRACAKVTGFKKLHNQHEKKIIVSGKNLSTLNNYIQLSHPIKLNTNEKLDLRLNYIHKNPVVAGIVRNPEEYLYNSA